VVDQIFSDGIGSIAVVGGAVRIDFMVFSPTEMESSGQPKAVRQQRIVMTLEGFMQSAEKMRSAAQALEKLGSRPAMQSSPQLDAPPMPIHEPKSTAAQAKRPFP